MKKLFSSLPVKKRIRLSRKEMKREFHYLIDEKGYSHLSCLLCNKVDHDCPAHLKI